MRTSSSFSALFSMGSPWQSQPGMKLSRTTTKAAQQRGSQEPEARSRKKKDGPDSIP
jgi:hypothetical protein